jgi:hypothetical protein
MSTKNLPATPRRLIGLASGPGPSTGLTADMAAARIPHVQAAHATGRQRRDTSRPVGYSSSRSIRATSASGQSKLAIQMASRRPGNPWPYSKYPAPKWNPEDDSPAVSSSQPIRFPGRRANSSAPMVENGTPTVIHRDSETPGARPHWPGNGHCNHSPPAPRPMPTSPSTAASAPAARDLVAVPVPLEPVVSGVAGRGCTPGPCPVALAR